MKRIIEISFGLMLTACTAAIPEGQVAARVDGIEITERELLSEAELTNLNLSTPAVREAVLQRLIDRKLLSAAARTVLASRLPAVQIETRRSREDVLARAYARRVLSTIQPVSEAEIGKFMRDNPHQFTTRTSYLVDRLTVAKSHRKMPFVGSPDFFATTLNSSGIPYNRRLVLIDSSTLSAPENARLAALTRGQTLQEQAADLVMLDTLVLKHSVVEPLAEQRARARSIIAKSRSTAVLNAALRRLREEADISFRAGKAK